MGLAQDNVLLNEGEHELGDALASDAENDGCWSKGAEDAGEEDTFQFKIGTHANEWDDDDELDDQSDDVSSYLPTESVGVLQALPEQTQQDGAAHLLLD